MMPFIFDGALKFKEPVVLCHWEGKSFSGKEINNASEGMWRCARSSGIARAMRRGHTGP